jgi:hypothetical protein
MLPQAQGILNATPHSIMNKAESNQEQLEMVVAEL